MNFNKSHKNKKIVQTNKKKNFNNKKKKWQKNIIQRKIK